MGREDWSIGEGGLLHWGGRTETSGRREEWSTGEGGIVHRMNATGEHWGRCHECSRPGSASRSSVTPSEALNLSPDL